MFFLVTACPTWAATVGQGSGLIRAGMVERGERIPEGAGVRLGSVILVLVDERGDDLLDQVARVLDEGEERDADGGGVLAEGGVGPESAALAMRPNVSRTCS